MISLFLKIAGRHFWRNRLYTIIHIAGLTIGLTSMLLALLYVHDETSFDDFHENNPHLFRITMRISRGGKITESGGTGQVQGSAFKSQIPEIQHYSRVMGGDISGDVRSGKNVFDLRMLFVDSTFFDVFSFKLLHGNPATALSDVHSVVITEKTARRFFNKTNAIGELLHLDNDPSAGRLGKPLIVTGIVKDPPANSSMQFDIILPFQFMQLSFNDNNWLNSYLGTFVVLHPDADRANVIRRFNLIAANASRDQISQSKEKPLISYGLQRITDIHLDPRDLVDENREAGTINGSKPLYSAIFLGTSTFILLMACINFINISIAGSLKRAKEIGVRKLTGSSRRQLIFQFLGESAIICLVAFLLAGGISILMLPLMNQISGKHILPTQLVEPQLLMWIFILFISNIAFTGIYPAYLITSLNPSQILYRKNSNVILHLPGRILIGFQVAVAVTMAVATMVFNNQMHFVQTRDLGYDPANILRIGMPSSDSLRQNQQTLAATLKSQANIKNVTLTGDMGRWETGVRDKTFPSHYIAIDGHYTAMLKIKLLEGRDFSENAQSGDQYNVLVNEAFVKAAGLQNPLGAHISTDPFFGDNGFTIIGVIKDFHFNSLHQTVGPLVMPSSAFRGAYELLVKLNKKSPGALGSVFTSYRRIMPNTSFRYSFLEDQNALAYEKDVHLQQLSAYAALISFFICILGLFGLAHLSITQRRKETGIRIVLGASLFELITLFSKDFFKILIISLTVAVPVSYYTTDAWLSDFAYRLDFPWHIFPVTTAIATVVVLVTIGGLTMRFASGNAADALRSE